MSKEQLQLTVTKGKDKKYNLLFEKGNREIELADYTQAELRMIKEVINKVLLNN